MKIKKFLLFTTILAAIFVSCKVETETEYVEKIVEVEKNDTTPPAAIVDESLSLVAGDSAVLLSWTNPDDEDFYGTKITFEPKAENVSQPIVIEGKASETSSAWFHGLSNDVEYTFSLVALDKSQNISEKVSKKIVPKSSADKTPPSAVTKISAEAGNQKILLSWENPTDKDFYGVWISEKNNSGTLTNAVFLKSPAKSFMVSELQNALEYEFSIVAIDTALNQSEVKNVSASPVDSSDTTPPEEVDNITVSAIDGNAVISWSVPGSDDFAGVELSLSPAAGTLTYPLLLRKESNSLFVSGLETGENYTFKIRSYDTSYNFSEGKKKSVTVGDSSDRTPTSKVTEVRATGSENKVLISWQNPADEDFYGVQISEKSNSGTLSAPVFIANPASSFTVSELANGTEYEFSIVALDNSFNKSEVVTVTGIPVSSADVTAPNDVSALTVSASDGNALISWINPTDTDFAGVKISMTPAVGTLSNPVEVAKTVTSISVGGLTVGSSYTFTVQSFDTSKNYSNGLSKTAAVTDTADYTPPAEVTNLTATNKGGAVLLTWTDAVDSDCYGYEVSVYESFYAVILQGTEKCFVSDLINGRNYSFTVKSIDENGNKSEGVLITATPEPIDTSNPLKIEFTISEELSNSEITVTVKVTSTSDIKRVVYKKNGSESPSKLLADADALPCHKVNENDNTLWTFIADEKDYWTVAAIDVAGREETAQIYTQTIDKTPPVEVTNVLSQYIKALNAVSISWNDPADTNKEYESPFDHVIISYTIDDATEKTVVPITIEKGTCSSYIENIQKDAEYYTFWVHSVDKLGNTSEGVKSKLYISNIIYATADDVVRKIGEMTQTCNVKVTGAITNITIDHIKTAIDKLTDGIQVKLDLSETNGISSIGYTAFKECSRLISVVIPKSVTSIESAAFLGCSSLKSVEIPDSVTSIGNSAFSGCSSLENVVIPDSVTNLGYSAFYGCSSLKSVVILDSVTSLGDSAFYNCFSLESVVIPDSVTSIRNYAFRGCSGLKSVVIPDSVTSLGDYAFYDCSSLECVVIPDSVTSLGDYAFYDCSSLESVVIPDSVTSIGTEAFYGCSSLESVVIPDSVTSIGNSAFWRCSVLKGVEIPDSVTSIGNSAFYGCSNLKSVEIPDSVTSIGIAAFSDCSSLESVEIPDSVTSLGDYAFSDCSSLESVVIPGSMTSIGSETFTNCTSLKSVEIPDSVTSIGSSVFKYCVNLVSITFTGTVSQWSAIEKDIQWNNFASAKKVVCSDGEVSL